MKLKLVALFALLALIGCSSTPSPKSAPVDVAGTVTLPDGKPVSNVTINFFPTSPSQLQVPFTLKADGKFDVKLIPGKYTFAFEGSGIKTIPTKYHSNSADNTLEVPDAGTKTLEIKLTN